MIRRDKMILRYIPCGHEQYDRVRRVITDARAVQPVSLLPNGKLIRVREHDIAMGHEDNDRAII